MVFAAAAGMTGCLGDEITGKQVIPALVQAPQTVLYKSDSNDKLQVRWTVSPTYTQTNFEGYCVKLFSSDSISIDPSNEDSLELPPLDSVIVPKGDTSYTFTKLNLGLRRYTAEVWGVRYPPQSKDTTILSQTPGFVSFLFDTATVYAPSNIYAASGAGATFVNLYWTRSKSDKNVGFAGYIVGYEDTTRTNPHVIWLPTLYPASSVMTDTTGLLPHSVTVPANQNPPYERSYKFWVKAVRKDSVQSPDSIGISWSGAERFTFSDSLDMGVFLGQVNFQYGVQFLPSTDSHTMFTVHYDGTNVTVNGLNGTTFVNRADTAIGIDNGSYFSRPFLNSDFSAPSITLPAAPSIGGAVIYALLPGGARARIFFPSQKNSYITSNAGALSIQAVSVSFQPAASNLLYF